MNKKTYLVFTTINPPVIAEDYCKNFQKFNHQKEIGIIIIGDKKSLNSASNAICKKLQKQKFDVQYFSITQQEKWLKKYPKLKKIIPYNSDNRRNIGYLMALEKNCRAIISIDDDNFPLATQDFFASHSIVGTRQKLPVIKTASSWYNICSLVKTEPAQKIYPRGYPYNKRWIEEKIQKKEKKIPIMLNTGLWFNDPDVDAITRIHRDIKIKKFTGKQSALEIGTFSPINTQNTALHADIIPAYYFVIMGEPLENLMIDRYGDIWSGFFVKKVMDTLGFYASFGNPVAMHRRNKHNLFKDLKQELGCIMYTDLIAEIVKSLNLQGNNAIDIYADLSNQLLKTIKNLNSVSADFKKYIHKLHYCQNIWLETIVSIQNNIH